MKVYDSTYNRVVSDDAIFIHILGCILERARREKVDVIYYRKNMVILENTLIVLTIPET